MTEANMGNTRPFAFAIFWRFVLCSAAASLVIGSAVSFILGFLSTTYFGPSNFGMHVPIVVGLFVLIASFIILNWILTSQIGRSFGGYRLVLERLA